MSFNSFPSPKPDSGIGSNIKSIQRGIANITGTALTAIVTISRIDPTKACLLLSFTANSGVNGIHTITTRGVITDATTLAFTRAAHNNDAVEITWQVIEYANVKSKQTGQYTLTPAAGNAEKQITISNIDPSKSFIYATLSIPSGNNAEDAWLGYRIINSNTIALRINGDAPGAVACIIEWQVIEFP